MALYQTLQFLLQGGELLDAALHLVQVTTGNYANFDALVISFGGEGQQLAYSINFEPELTRASDKDKPGYLGLRISTLLTICTSRGQHQARSFIVADSRNLHARAAR